MKQKNITASILITCIVGVLLLIIGITNRDFDYAKKVYQVYLNGTKIGLLDNKEELYKLINEEQKDIKERYNVQNVYPPNGFLINEYQTFNEDVTSAKDIYETIKNKDDFTVQGYIVKIKFDDKEKEDLNIYVLDEQVFKDALISVITAFVDSKDYYNYINDTQEPIDEVGEIIEDLYFKETITIKPSYISVKEKIYTNATELTQYLLFNTETSKKSFYTVKAGDTISTISEENRLNTQEFLIANPKFRNSNSILAIGESVDVTLINPILTLVEDLHSVSDIEQDYDIETNFDATKPISFNEVTQNGITGIERVTRNSQIVNGEPNQGVDKINSITIRAVQNEVITKGGSRPSGYYVDNGRIWGWPTNRPYVITSDFAYRWGSFHSAIDISGTGLGSQIYASRDGTVVGTEKGCDNFGSYRNQCGNTYGNHVIIDHHDGKYTMYAHLLQNVSVNVGDNVKRGQVIGFMGSSGSSTGAHLHFGVSSGYPDEGTWLNPWSLFR